ncbi:ribosomal RNA processing protein 1 homolog B isoform X2 [Nannospalax galili]|uniref:ribosomal RNA processing protein 1 homolog B isoform X2 n=1 Tax=Nannospalax galili TaxID=1026970 RepID=UPI0004ED53FE|nr:ribosomal RNA processing protein 1 homolog B isoform X2 [Nannospalax galili]
MRPAMPSAELQFAQRLASSEKGIRERAVRKLRQYLSVRTQGDTGGFSQEELLKIWRGLFYCMWVQDEPLLQEELANTISQLIHVVNNSEAQHLFIQTFWQTMNREWQGIDKLQLDKYCMLTRLVLRQSFEVLKRNDWEESQIKIFLDVLMKEILCPDSQSPDGVRVHLVSIYLAELSTVGGRELLADQNLKFIDPFCRIAAKTKDHTLVQTIARTVFEVIVDQSAFVPEETVKEQKTKVGDCDLSKEEIPANKMAWRNAVPGKKAELSECLGDGVGDGRDTDGFAAFRDSGSPLQFDYKAIADRLLEITNKKDIPPFNRKRLCKLIRKFQNLSAGSNAQLGFAEDISANENGQALSQGRHKKKRKILEKTALEKEKGNKVFLADEEDSEGSIQKRKRKREKRSHCQPEAQGLEDTTVPPAQGAENEPSATQGCETETETTSSIGAESGSQPPRLRPRHSKRKRLKKKSLRAHSKIWRSATSPLEDMSESDPSLHSRGSTARVSSSETVQVLKKKRRLGTLPVNGDGLTMVTMQKTGPPASPVEGKDGQATLPQCRRPQKKAQSSSLSLCDLSCQKTAILKKRKKRKEMSHLVEHNGVLEPTVRQIQALGSSSTPGPLKKPLRTENDFVKFDTNIIPKPLFFKKAKGNTATSPSGPAVQLNRTPPSSKKVTFGLSRNMTAEFKKTDKSILVSPTGLSRVAFNPEQKPLHGVLKTPTSSPACTPLATRKPPATTPKRRPRAADFF